jgi:hypothetical protein
MAVLRSMPADGRLPALNYITRICGRATYKLTWEEIVAQYRLTLGQPAVNTRAVNHSLQSYGALTDVRLGSKKTSFGCSRHVRFTPESDRLRRCREMTRWANSCLTHPQQKNGLPLRRRTTVKSVTDLLIGA